MPETASDPRHRADGPLTVATWLCLVAVIPPYLRVVDSGPWTLTVAVLAALVLGATYLARRRRLPAVVVTLVGLVVWAMVVTLVFFRDTAFLWGIPTPDTLEAVQFALGAASDEIQNSAAPVAAGVAMSFLLVASMGLLAVVVDHVMLTARMPIVAAVALIAVTLVPPFVVPGDVDVVGFVLLAAAILVAVRAETRGRARLRETRAAPRGGSAAPLAIGAVALVVALVVTPFLPRPSANIALTPGSATISTDLSLGDDLRRPREVEVLRERTTAAGAPYLRVSTLTTFDGAVWRADVLEAAPLDDDVAFSPDELAEGIATSEVETAVRVSNLASPYLPIPYPAVAVEGLRGDWLSVPANRTVVSEQTDSREQTYSVTTSVPTPTLDQIRALPARGEALPPEATEVPPDLPSIIGENAAEITAGAANDYDRLVALQDWFRGPDFTYSLEAPVNAGFDGSGAEAVAEFLTRREGYCVHFASSFALMARTLGMPSRVVVGYLPGVPTDQTVDGQTVYAVTSGQLHAWPEVYFEGLGWIPFEPTRSLGVPTAYAATADTGGSTADEPAPTATTAPSERPDTETIAPRDDTAGADASGSPLGRSGAGLWVVVGLVVALLLPALVRRVLSAVAAARARRGDAAAAWSEARATALDFGLDATAADSPRALGARLVAAGAPAGAVDVLVTEIERASYAPPSSVESEAPLADALRAVRQGLAWAAGRRRTVLAALAPRSLVVRSAPAPAR